MVGTRGYLVPDVPLYSHIFKGHSLGAVDFVNIALIYRTGYIIDLSIVYLTRDQFIVQD